MSLETRQAPDDAGRAQPLRIALLWHSLRSENLGVGALTLAQILIAREAARRAGVSIALDVVGFPGPERYAMQECDGVEETMIESWRSLLPGSPLWYALRRADLVLDIGAGDSFADIYGPKRFGWIVAPKLIAMAAGTPLVLAPQTIGPFERIWARALAHLVLRGCRGVFARDGRSRAVVERSWIGARALETVDVAFLLPYEPAPRADGERLRVGVNASALLWVGGYSGANQFGLAADYPATIRALLASLGERPKVDVVLVPHVLATGRSDEDDYALARVLQAELPRIEIAPAFRSPIEAKSFISGLDLLVGSRMHATIAAASSGVPVLPLAYSRKFVGLFDAVDYPLVVDLRTAGTEEVLNALSNALQHLPELRRAADASGKTARAKLSTYVDWLAETLARLAAARAPAGVDLSRAAIAPSRAERL